MAKKKKTKLQNWPKKKLSFKALYVRHVARTAKFRLKFQSVLFGFGFGIRFHPHWDLLPSFISQRNGGNRQISNSFSFFCHICENIIVSRKVSIQGHVGYGPTTLPLRGPNPKGTTWLKKIIIIRLYFNPFFPFRFLQRLLNN